MENEIKVYASGAGAFRWLLIAVGAAAAAFLAATLETGRVHAQSGTGFEFTAARVRIITPNGDKRNDLAVLCFENPKDSAIKAEVFDLRGQKVAEMLRVRNADTALKCPAGSGPAPQPEAAKWDGRADGRVVASGVYVYRIQAETRAATGTILVVR